jgi:small subunit ribosomal protein S1
MAESGTEGPKTESFAALLDESLSEVERLEGTVLKGTIIAIEGDSALIDVGLKSEGRVALKEFAEAGQPPELKVGDDVEVYLDRMENKNGEAVLSREKARREEAWTQLETSFNDSGRVTGVIFGRVKGGFTVDLSGAVAFLPGSQVDIRPVRDVSPLMGTPQPFQILKMDRSRGNIVVSRRAVLEETRAEQRSELVAGLKEGQVLEGVVKNITDYGAFVDLGGVDGLLHVTDISWKRVNHPTDALSIGQQVNVQVIRFNPETQRISLGMKQLEADPWEGVAAKYPIEARFTGRVTNITDYGAFVELEAGVEGLVHVSEMSWTKKNVHPGKIVPIPGTPSSRTTKSARSSRAKSRTSPSSACSSACPATSTAWSTSPTSTGSWRARMRSRNTRRAIPLRSRCSTSTSPRSASASASSSLPRTPSRAP